MSRNSLPFSLLVDPPSPRSVAMAPSSAGTLKCAPVFDMIADRVKAEGPSLVRKVKGTFYFKITGSDGTVQEWLVDLKNGNGSVTKNPGKKGDCNIAMKDEDFVNMVSGKLGPQKAFFEGKLKVTGNTALAMKLQTIVPRPGKAKL